MDIIDIMLARAMTPQGQTETYVSIANAAAAKAEKAEQDATAAIETVEAAADEIATAREEAASLLEEAQNVLETAQEAQINMPEVYTTTGQNTDGYMTQKAVTDALATKADSSSLNIYVTTNAMNIALAEKANVTDLAAKADKTYVDQQIANIPAGGGGGAATSMNLGPANAGNIVVIGSDGNIMSGEIAEEDIIEALLKSGSYIANHAVGLEIDYANKTYSRVQEAAELTMGSDFDSYPMYGGRRRCNVLDNGTITAFYGDENYKEDGSNGQVMVYQPKFYYQRIPLTTTTNKVGKTVEKDSILVSYIQQSGFKVHPVFVLPNGNELDYVLFSAYEGSVYDVSEGTYTNATAVNVDFSNDKMTSVAGTKPITGSSGMNALLAERLATNRGAGWHILTMEGESANQMLELIEFGTLNGQASLGKGICTFTTTSEYNQSSLTGSTASLGNASGEATSTVNEVNGVRTAKSGSGELAISYRGLENPWGNTWCMIGNVIISGDGKQNGGVPYICKDYNYSYASLANNYHTTGFSLPNAHGWISRLGYGNKEYDWVLMPSAINDGNSVLPIGDSVWVTENLNSIRTVVFGGSWAFEDSNGLFYYGCDKMPTNTMFKSYGARLMFVPTKNSIYTANITKWQQEVGA